MKLTCRILAVMCVGVFAVSLAQGTTILTVAADGSKEYKTVQSAVNALPSSGGEIQISPGTYTEQVTVSKPNVQLRGTSTTASSTVITYAKDEASAGSDQGSATVYVENSATNFFADNLTIQNTWDISNGQDASGSMAVALFIQADRSVLRNVRIIGRQDTLYAGAYGCTSMSNCTASRQYFSDCYIEGNVDFIFGNGTAVFDGCTIGVKEHDNLSDEATITAQYKTYSSQYSGFVFNSCTLDSTAGMTELFLGRPWGEYATVVYLNTVMNASINAAGWIEWSSSTDYLKTAYFGEYNSSGTGAAGTRESYAKKLTASQAAAYAPDTFLKGSDGWDPTSIE